MKRLIKIFQDNVTTPVVDVVRPQAYRLFKRTRPRDSNAFVYRYPSPASEYIDPKRFDRAHDHRVPYKDSIYDIKNHYHISASSPPEQYFYSNGITADIDNHLKSKLSSYKGLCAKKCNIPIQC
jgi:hypothetical protein